jgi:hypothetical protein
MMKILNQYLERPHETGDLSIPKFRDRPTRGYYMKSHAPGPSDVVVGILDNL